MGEDGELVQVRVAFFQPLLLTDHGIAPARILDEDDWRELEELLEVVDCAKGEFLVYQSGNEVRSASVRARFTAAVEEVR